MSRPAPYDVVLEMTAFDSLPPPLRALLREADTAWSAVDLCRHWADPETRARAGLRSEAEVIARVQQDIAVLQAEERQRARRYYGRGAP